MNKLVVDFTRKKGPIKIMNAVNNGPLPVTEERTRSNFDDYKALRIPYARTHDASFCAEYGGEHTVDVNFIFSDFNADETDPSNYDFQLTDEYLKTMIDAGTEPFFRLGSKIEHWSKKYNTRMPEDFEKWARISEHIIAHYTEGWANGYAWKITYWEIWNEADGQPDDAPPEAKSCWSGTRLDFFRFYTTVASHLKARFPHLKIGGPACCGTVGSWRGLHITVTYWVDSFLRFVRDNNAPLDFFSWHGYTCRPENFVLSAKKGREVLDKYGFTSTESILNEWNYLFGWEGKTFFDTIKDISSIRGAVFNAAMMIACQNAPVDMLMYYDARPSTFNGLFDYYTQKPMKGYYSFAYFARLAEMGTQVFSCYRRREVYALAAEGNGKKGILIAYYPLPTKKSKKKNRTINVQAEIKNVNCYLTDETHTNVPLNVTLSRDGFAVTLRPYSVLYVEGE